MTFDRGEWLEQRRKGIGGSDAAAILGLSRYRSAIDVWEDKLGLVAERPQTPAMAWGLRLEDTLAVAFTETTGIRVRKVNGIRRAKHVRDFPMIGSLDRIASDGRIVELKKKRTDHDLADDGPPEKRVPPDWYVQVQHYMEVVGSPLATFAILVAGTDFRTIDVPRDEAFGADLRDEEGRFWRDYVETGQQPPVGPDDLAFLQRRYPVSADVEKVATSEVSLLVTEYLATVDQLAKLETRRDDYRARIEAFMGPASRLASGPATISWKSHEVNTTSWKEYASSLEAAIAKLRESNPANFAAVMSDGFGTTSLEEVRSLYSKTRTDRPFKVDRKKEDA
jgi:putative phage-type endonuclease